MNRALAIARALLDGRDVTAGDDSVARAAREHVGRGPLPDALLCLALSGDPRWLDGAPATAARVDLLIWEAGRTAMAVPELAAALLVDAAARRRFVDDRARGPLRARALAARLLAIAADGVDTAATADLLAGPAGELASHPESAVWIPAVRALGRLSARSPGIRLRLQRMIDGGRSERRRATAALACAPLPAGLDDDALRAVLRDGDGWRVAALGIATPLLVRERPAIAAEVIESLLGAPTAAAVWSTTLGLVALVPASGGADPAIADWLRAARKAALAARAHSATEAQLWIEARRVTDFLDDIDPDPAFPDDSLERAVASAVRVNARAVATRAASIARSIAASFDAMLRVAGTAGGTDERAHALSAVESCTRAAALALWQPLLLAAGRDPIDLAGDLAAARAHMGAVLSGYLEADELDFALRRVALRGLGHLVDVTGAERDRSQAAAFALRALAGSRWATRARANNLRRFRKPVTDLLWRLGDAIRADGDDPALGRAATLGRVAAWWALCAGGLELLSLVDPETPAVRARIDGAIAAIRAAAGAAIAGASTASWSAEVTAAVDELGASGTALALAVGALLTAVDDGESALRGGSDGDVAYAIARLCETAAELSALGADPAAALAPALSAATIGGIAVGRVDAELEQRVAAASVPGGLPADIAASAVAERVGPLLRPAVESLVRALIERRVDAARAARPTGRIGPYHTLHRLGSGGHGEVWLVRRDGNRRFVLKIPRRGAAMSASMRASLAELLEREAALLEGLHEGKVASFIDYGWDGDLPYLVLEYLVGADLHRYKSVRPLSLGEAAPIVRDVCIGLRALHGRGIVHRDLKPSNVFLRLQLPADAGEQFTDDFRDPQRAPVADAVLIDFGVARVMRDAGGGDHPEGTLGYISPEQAESSDVITGASDIYALAATLFDALTGYRFFEDRVGATAQLIAHAFERPLRTRPMSEQAVALPDELVALLDRATSLDPDERPDVDAFAAAFARISATA